jgi:hypothetical protein
MKPCFVRVEKIDMTNHHIYNCKFCDMTSRFFKYVQRHMRKRHSDKTFYMCDYVACMHLFFISQDEKNKHIKEQHTDNSDGAKFVRCVYCDRGYLNNDLLSSHLSQFHRNIVMKCNYTKCGTYFQCEADRQKHVEEKHQLGDKTKKCVYCDKVFEDKRYLRIHSKRMHKNIMIKCKYLICGSYFKCEADHLQHVEEIHKQRENTKKCVHCNKWVQQMSEHVKNHHNHVNIKCNFSRNCGSYFKNESDREEHSKKVHLSVKVKQKVDCIYCGKPYPHTSAMGKHIKLMHSLIAIRCSIIYCPKYFITQEDCNKHFMEIHSEKEKLRKIVCPQCNFKTGSKYYLTRHIKEFHNEKEIFKCKRCPDSEKIFKSCESLKYQINLMHKNNMQICPHCKKSIFKPNLISHLSSEYCSYCEINYLCIGTMTEHKKWCKQKCNICLIELTSDIALLKHITKFHVDVNIQELEWLGDLRNLRKDIKCEQCNRQFYKLKALNRHVMMSHRTIKELKPLPSCDLCKKQFSLRCNLQRHMKNVHKF